jgi:hypothetical protein
MSMVDFHKLALHFICMVAKQDLLDRLEEPERQASLRLAQQVRQAQKV